jgi:hypothetical protein
MSDGSEFLDRIPPIALQSRSSLAGSSASWRAYLRFEIEEASVQYLEAAAAAQSYGRLRNHCPI